MNTYCLIITEMGEAASVLRFLSLAPADVTALVIGGEALARDAAGCGCGVKWIDADGEPAENYADAAGAALAGLSPTAVIGVATSASRAAIGAAAKRLGAPIVPNLIRVCAIDESLRIDHAIYSDKMIETLRLPMGACLLVNPFNLQDAPAEGGHMPGAIERIAARSGGFAEIVEHEEVAASRLQTAEVVVGVGLGASSEELFAQARELAALLGAELGCSMPVYSELALLPHENYIGVSGCKIAPRLYIALGISGTSQHCAGVRNAKNIICINKDPKALFFDNADYGAAADLNELLPTLIAALKQ